MVSKENNCVCVAQQLTEVKPRQSPWRARAISGSLDIWLCVMQPTSGRDDAGVLWRSLDETFEEVWNLGPSPLQ